MSTCNSSFGDESLFTPSQHEDHQYCRRDLPVTSSVSTVNWKDCEEPGNHSEVGWQSFNCTGAVVEISQMNDTIQADQTAPTGDVIGAEESLKLLPQYDDVHPVILQLDPAFTNVEIDFHPLNSISVVQETCSSEDHVEQEHVVQADVSSCGQADCELSDVSEMLQKTSTVPHLCQPGAENSVCAVQLHSQDDEIITHPENDSVVETEPQAHVNATTLDEETTLLKVEENLVTTPLDQAEPATPHMKTDVSGHLQPPSGHVHMLSSNEQSPCSGARDSAFGSSENVPNLSDEKPMAETLPEVLRILSECPSMALQLGILSPIVQKASPADANKGHTLGSALATEAALEENPAHVEASVLWAEQLEGTMSPPLFNSTTLGCKPQVCTDENAATAALVPEANKPHLDTPLIPDGPLQQQLRQMAEFLLLASGKMCVGASSAFVPPPAPAETLSVCVGTTAVNMVDCSLNTSGQFVRKRDFSVADACTLTEPLLWNVPPGSLECLHKTELKQRLRSSMIMVEALVQQLSVTRATRRDSVGPPPSELRDKLVQTDHTELSQTSMYRDLYVTALKRIEDLELDGRSLENLVHRIQDMQLNMASLSSDLDSGLSNMTQVEELIREDHQSLASHYGAMKSLLQRSKETQGRMMVKVRDALEQRDDMRTRMDDACSAKEAAYSVVDQLRSHSAREITELQKCAGSQQELLAALNATYPQQVELNEASANALDSASALLHQTLEEQSSLIQELCKTKKLLHKTTPALLKLNDRAAAAVRERDEHRCERDGAVEEKEQVEDELRRTKQSLESAREEVGALNLQVTILTSEMGVLRQKLSDQDKEQAELETKMTEMSATVSSTVAAHTFLEHALAAESAKLLEAQNDLWMSSERTVTLESSLSESEQRTGELNRALADAAKQLNQLQELAQFQEQQIQQLQEVCTKLNGVQELNEFLQMENDLVREQMSESEGLLKENLQGLRERNLQCEDLKIELSQLKVENENLHEDLEDTRQRASDSQLQLEEKLDQAATEVTLLHHTLRGVTDDLLAALSDENQEDRVEAASGSVRVERRHPSSSFVDSIMVALTTDDNDEAQTDDLPPEPDSASLFSGTGAFTRIPVIVSHDASGAEESDSGAEQSNVTHLLADLGDTVSELVAALQRVQEHRQSRVDELLKNIDDLHTELKSANGRRESEVSELKQQLSRMSGLLERGNQALEEKAQNVKLFAQLTREMAELQDGAAKYKLDNNDLRKVVTELQHSLQQSQAESQVLRGEVQRAGGQLIPSVLMEEKIQLFKEVTRLKRSLQEADQAKVKLLDRAKRHQIIHQANQQKSEKELYMLSNMINRVRETLLALPHVLNTCEQLQQLAEYIG